MLYMKQHVSDGSALPYELEHVQSINYLIARSALKLIRKRIILVLDNLLFMLKIARLILNILNGCGLLLNRQW